jgi:hypothetical protein
MVVWTSCLTSSAMLGWTGPPLARGSSSSLTLVYFVVAISLDVCIVVVRLYRGGMRMEPGGDEAVHVRAG